MAENEEFLGLGVEGPYSTDEAIKRALKLVGNKETPYVNIVDGRTGDVTRVDSSTVSTKSGYTRSFADSWDAMKARMAAREAKGQRSTDD